MSAKNRGAVVAPHEFYPTPDYTTFSLLSELKRSHGSGLKFGEPCLGDGSIADCAIEYFMLGVDQVEWAELRRGRDYLKDGLTGGVSMIITNPPFSLATQFIDKSLEDAPFVAYLLRLNFLGSKKRKEWWQDKMPTHLFTLSRRPSFTGKGTDATEYAWFVWDRAGLCKRPPGMYVI